MELSVNKPVFPVVCVIPSLNPDQKLVETVRGILAAGFTDVIVVDDGSREACQQYFEAVAALPGCAVLHHEVNRGKGGGLKTAFTRYLDRYDQHQYMGVVTADADGQHLPEDIMKCARALIHLQTEHDSQGTLPCMILGTRDFNEEIVPPKSRNGNKITSRVFQLLYGRLVGDVMTGLRAISNGFLTHCLKIPEERFEYEVRMLMDAVAQKIHIEEELIHTVYFDNNRETHFDAVRDSIRIYKLLFKGFFKFAVSSLLCVLLDQGLFAIFEKLIFASLAATTAIPLATALARAISSFVNYSVNRNVVFQKTSGRQDLLRYYVLCVGQAAVSAGLVTALHTLTRVDASLWKLVVDTCLFFVSYRIQRIWVFREERT